MQAKDPFRPADDTARALAEQLLAGADHAALAVLRPETATPSVTRIALAMVSLQPVSLVSSLAEHTRALQANPACSLLIGDPGEKGDPLTHPRLTLHCTARLINRTSQDHMTLRTRYLSVRPKAHLYIDFTDFSFVRFDINDALLNGGFGKAWRLSKGDL